MLKNLGLEVQHAPGHAINQGYLARFDAMGDTPCFKPSLIDRLVHRAPQMKFIYIDKTATAWVESMQKVKLSDNYNRMYNQWLSDPKSLNIYNMTDLESLKEVLNGPFERESAIKSFLIHKKKVEEIIPSSRLLIYNFSQGWGPLANFVGREAPDKEVPHLNRTTMFDKITG